MTQKEEKAVLDTQVNINRIINILNEITLLSPQSIKDLCSYRVQCNQAIIDHPDIIVNESGLGILGILNGVLGHEYPYRIAMMTQDDELLGFTLIKAE